MHVIKGLFVSAFAVGALGLLFWGMANSSGLLKAGVCAVIFLITLAVSEDRDKSGFIGSVIQPISLIGCFVYLGTWFITGGQV